MREDYETATPQETLKESRSERERLLMKWGFEPVQLWLPPKIHDTALDVIVEDTLAQGTYETHGYSVRSGALPQSSPIIADRIIRFWSEPGDVVGNPFMERAPALLIANYRGRHVFGQDLCEKFYNHNVEKVSKRIRSSAFLDSESNQIISQTKDKFVSKLNGLDFEMRLGDSRKIDLPNSSWDLCINSPPYGSTIKYDDNPNQLGTGVNNAKDGKIPTYEEFLRGLQDVYREVYRIVKPGGFNAVILNDYRTGGIFYPYHADLLPYMKEIGWILHDIVIYPLSYHPLHAIFATELSRDKHMAKQVEYILIFRKTN